ncbi:hypothetical protein JCM10207_005458 [Rhodosporidiobolus poonsookiae]
MSSYPTSRASSVRLSAPAPQRLTPRTHDDPDGKKAAEERRQRARKADLEHRQREAEKQRRNAEKEMRRHAEVDHAHRRLLDEEEEKAQQNWFNSLMDGLSVNDSHHSLAKFRPHLSQEELYGPGRRALIYGRLPTTAP